MEEASIGENIHTNILCALKGISSRGIMIRSGRGMVLPH
jgi:hypothetical protein